MVSEQVAYVTKSTSNDDPRYPRSIHIIREVDMCYCGAEITGPLWFINDSRWIPATCKKCLKIKQADRGK